MFNIFVDTTDVVVANSMKNIVIENIGLNFD